MIGFFKKPKVTFYSSIPSVTREFPIIPAKTYKRKWFKKASEEYKIISSDLKNLKHHFSGVSKCPGIINLMTEGWILQSWFDFIIEINPATGSCSFTIPPTINDEIKTRYPHFGKTLIQFMNINLPQMKVPVPEDTYPMLIKVATPWAAKIPEGWRLLFLPVPYSDDLDFTSTAGILSPGDREINPQLFWKISAEPRIIPAGTPLCQIIPIPDNSLDFECLDYTEEQVKEQDDYFFKKAFKFSR